MKIEWASNYTPDGYRRTPPPSIIHGWLAKWRGTLIGNESLRNRGMAEMRKAASFRRARKRYEQKKAMKGGRSNHSLLSFFRAKGSQKGKRLAGSSRTQSSRSKGSRSSRHPTIRKPELKSSPRNAASKKRPPLRKTKPRQGRSCRPVHSRS